MQCVCEHCPVEIKDCRRGMLECPRGQGGANGAVDLGRHGQSLIRSLASRGLGDPAGSPRSNPIPSTLSDDGFWAGYSLFSISPEVFGKPIVGALLAPAPHCTHHCRSPSESPPRSSPCEPAPIGGAPLHDLPSILVAFCQPLLYVVFAEHAIDGVNGNTGIDSADLFTCVLPALPYRAQDRQFISFGKDFRPAGP